MLRLGHLAQPLFVEQSRDRSCLLIGLESVWRNRIGNKLPLLSKICCVNLPCNEVTNGVIESLDRDPVSRA
jgi:hypothetical protein